MHNLDRTYMEMRDFEARPGAYGAYGDAGEWSNAAESGWYDEGEGQWYEGEDEGYYEGEGDWYAEGEDSWYEGEDSGYYESERGWYPEAEETWYEGEDEGYYEGEGDWYAEGEDSWYEGEDEGYYGGEGEFYNSGEGAWYGEQENGISLESPFEEMEEMSLAAELLNVGSDQEFDRFIKVVMKHASHLVGSKGSSKAFGPLRQWLRGIGRQILPVGGAALGNMFAPGVGGMVGSATAGQVGRLFGLETEGMSPEDEDYEVARRYVRLVGAAAQEVAQTPPVAPPEQIAQHALMTAVQQHAPGIVVAPDGMPTQPRPYGRRRLHGRRQGTWTRHGDTIVLHGVR